jgi:hypothetical protein
MHHYDPVSFLAFDLHEFGLLEVFFQAGLLGLAVVDS